MFSRNDYLFKNEMKEDEEISQGHNNITNAGSASMSFKLERKESRNSVSSFSFKRQANDNENSDSFENNE